MAKWTVSAVSSRIIAVFRADLARMFDMQGKEIELYNRRVVAMDLEHLRGAPWSMCVCDSARKASAVSAALRGKLFNTLVINEEAARAVGAG